MELLFDDEFGLSDGDISEEEGENTCCYKRKTWLIKELVEDLVILQAFLWMSKSERATRVTFKR